MSELQKNNWQGGIDEKVIREAEDLLDRANKAITNYSLKWDDPSKDHRLSADIQINQAIAKMARLKYEENISEKTRNSLNEIVDSLISLDSSIKKESSGQQYAVTEASTLGKSRVKCYYQQAFLFGSLSDSPRVNGFDPLIKQDDEIDACFFALSIGVKFYIPSDRNLLKNYRFAGSQSDRYFASEVKDISSFMELIYRYPSEAISKYKNRIVLIQDSEIYLSLANQLSQIIQENYVKGDKKYDQDIIWRLLLSKDGKLIAYFAYDDLSRELGNAQPFITEGLEQKTINTLSAELAKGGKIEFADFKVLISPEGKVKHIIPWAMAYPSSVKYVEEICREENCKNLILEPRIISVFKNYAPDLNNPSELGVLQTVLQLNKFSWAITSDKGIYYEEPAIFKLKVSADGQIVDYEAINQVAIQKLEKKLPYPFLKIPQFPELVKAPYAYFKMEVRGFQVNFFPWSDLK